MKTYEITFKKDSIYSVNLVIAENAEQAAAYFATLGNYEIVGVVETASSPKPGQPCHMVPDSWKPARVEKTTADELHDMCQRVREELQALYDADYSDEEREEREESGEACDLYDYFNDVLDYEFAISSRRDMLGVKVWVTLGGPNIWIDTREGYIKGAWGTDRADVWLPSEIADEISTIFEDIYNCI